MLTQDKLKSQYSYDETTGIFKRLYSNRKCGSLDTSAFKPYIRITVCGKKYRAHRLAWLYVYGRMPSGEIDHINGNSLDNRISNLRDVVRDENNRNTMTRKDCASGVMGVKWRKQRRSWLAMIHFNKKQIILGSSKDFFEAVCMRKSAENFYNFGPSHGCRFTENKAAS